MAVVIASDLGKDIAGEPLLRGHLVQARAPRPDDAVRAQRRRQDDAAADARRRGVGRRRRARAREGRQGRAARPAPAARARRCRCATTCSRARASWSRSSSELRDARAGDGRRRPRRADAEPLRRGAGPARARRRLHVARAGAGDAARPRLPRRRRPRPLAGDVLRRRADARLARPARWPATPTCCCSTSRPTTSTSSRSSGSSSTCVALDAAIVLVAHDRWFLEAVGTAVLELEAGRGKFFAGPWHAWRKEQAARELALGRAIERQQAEIERLERFVDPVPRRDAGAAGAVAGQAAGRRSTGSHARPDRRRGARVRVQAAGAQRPRGVRARGAALQSAGEQAAAATTPSCGSSAASTCRSSAPNGAGKTTLIETLAGRRELDGGQAAHRPQRQDRLPLPARRGARRRARRGPCSRRASARRG